MAKALRDITTGKLSGVKSSKVEPMDVSDLADSKGTKDFAKKHKIEKHADRVGNGDDVYKSKLKPALSDPKNSRMKPKEGVYEETEPECSGKKKLLLDKISKKMKERDE